MCGKSIDDVRKTLQKKPEEQKKQEPMFPGVDEEVTTITKRQTESERDRKLKEIHTFVDALK